MAYAGLTEGERDAAPGSFVEWLTIGELYVAEELCTFRRSLKAVVETRYITHFVRLVVFLEGWFRGGSDAESRMIVFR